MAWDAPDSAWPNSVVRGHVVLLLDLHTEAEGDAEVRRRIHRLRALADALEGAVPAPGLVTVAAGLLVAIAAAWTDGRPEVLDEIAAAGPTAAAVAHARTVLSAIEVVRGAFEPHEPAAEQVVRLGLLTPQRPACLDAVRRRTTTAEKLAGEELGHFGAFLKRSWRANDWLWGRLDASTFLFEIVAGSGAAPTVDRQRAIQAAIVREEAPHICAAVIADRHAGAVSPAARSSWPGRRESMPRRAGTTSWCSSASTGTGPKPTFWPDAASARSRSPMSGGRRCWPGSVRERRPPPSACCVAPSCPWPASSTRSSPRCGV